MDIAKRILLYCDALNISVNHLADISGIAQSTLQSLVSGSTSTTQLSTIEKICDGLGITLEDFFRDSNDLPIEAQQELNLFKQYLKWKYKT
ncbi:MAG: helix-turn-helix transcriptional regulator [Sporomusaceae bacterium]|nr:helix-turn-helix transcriptional regulator [Sporomusaceae bacterium]